MKDLVTTSAASVDVPATPYEDVATELFNWLVKTYGKPETRSPRYVNLKQFDAVVDFDPAKAGFPGAVGIVTHDYKYNRRVALWLSAPEGAERGYVDVFDRDPILTITIGFVRPEGFSSLYDAGCFVQLDKDTHAVAGPFGKALPIIGALLTRAAQVGEAIGHYDCIEGRSLEELIASLQRMRAERESKSR